MLEMIVRESDADEGELDQVHILKIVGEAAGETR